MVLELFSGRGDISFDFYISFCRVKVVDFIELYMFLGICFLVKEKKCEDN